ncbi:MAG: hypothetical protein KC877_04795 [Candidatus Kaiserbacteria bacterium]|nr:hypothetical protein [Candidatus Kaiserbacteria bacterium]MCB9816866.1 hypothetical protein [Candidatus Nomurabacteria bacterium]
MDSSYQKSSLVKLIQLSVLIGMLFFGLVHAANAEVEVDWVKQYGAANHDDGHDVVAVDGYTYVVGAVSSALPGESYSGGLDAYIRKYDSAGNIVWTDQFGTAQDDYAVSVTANQNYVVVVGMTNGTFPGKTNHGGQDVFIRTYELNGTLVLNQQVGTTETDIARAVAVDEYYMYVVGATPASLDGHLQSGQFDAYIQKIHLTGGAVIWTRQIGTGESEWATGITYVNSSIYVLGNTFGAISGFTSQGGSDVFIRKYDTNGNTLWTQQFGTAGYDLLFDATEQGSYVYVVGDTSGAFSGETNVGSDDAFIRKYNASNGSLVWTDQYGTSGTDEAYAVVSDATGVYVGGFVEGALPGETALGSYDVYVRKYDFDGSILSTNQFGTTGGEDLYGLTMDGGYLYLTGTVDGSWSGYTNGGEDDGYMVRLSQDLDGDGIYDSVDTQTLVVSSDFSDGTTYGSVVTVGDQTLSIKDSLVSGEGVIVTATAGGGSTQAEVFACGISTFYLDAGDSVTITCGSVTFDVEGGEVRVVFYADDGRVAESTVGTGNQLTFDAVDGSVEAPSTNADNVVITAGNEVVILAPGNTDEMPSDMPITVDELGFTAAAIPVGSNTTLLATVSSPIDEVSTITGVEYWVNTGAHVSAAADDGAFDEETESIQVDLGTFAAPGVYEVCVMGHDNVGNVSETGCTILAVYDPTGGYVTGGGQFESPAGAYVADPTLTGKAHFGFIAEYEAGMQTPTGNTQFRFNAGDLKFKSTSYDWLVVAGARAQYKGYGEIDKQAGYRFMLTAVDGDLLGQGASDDTFRMKIWDDATGGLVYDNQLGASEAATPSTVISNGSIVIHSD